MFFRNVAFSLVEMSQECFLNNIWAVILSAAYNLKLHTSVLPVTIMIFSFLSDVKYQLGYYV